MVRPPRLPFIKTQEYFSVMSRAVLFCFNYCYLVTNLKIMFQKRYDSGTLFARMHPPTVQKSRPGDLARLSRRGSIGT